MKNLSVSTQAKLLARYLKDKGLVALSHSQALEALAHSRNLKAYNVLASQIDDDTKPAAVEASKPNHERAVALIREAIAAGLEFADAISILAESRSAVELLYVETAQARLVDEGELEVDDNAGVSLSADGGAYVMSWSWVARSQLATPANLALGFAIGYETIGVSLATDAAYEKYAVSELDLNHEALSILEAGGVVDPALWLVRTRAGHAHPFTLTGAHYAALALNEKGDCYEGKLDGEELFFEFHTD
jgi:hypothetical protein